MADYGRHFRLSPFGPSLFHVSALTRFDPGRKDQPWSAEERRLLIAMRRHGIQRKVIARILLRTPAAVKKQIELMR
jgi:hypothetical protein